MPAASIPLGAQDLPDKPQPQPAGREFWIDTAALATTWTLDTVSTAQAFGESPTHHETGFLFTGSRSTAKVMGAWAALDVAMAATGYEWKRHIHNRYLHPLWRVPMLWRVEGHMSAAVGNWTLPQPTKPTPFGAGGNGDGNGKF